MDCLICDQPARDAGRGVDHQDVDCVDCGGYRVAGTTLRAMAVGESFRIHETRDWLKLERAKGIDRPVINSNALTEVIAGVRTLTSL